MGTEFGNRPPYDPIPRDPRSLRDSQENNRQFSLLIADSLGRVEMFLCQPDQLPKSMIPLDGRSVSRKDYPRLFGLWGDLYGAGDGSTTFLVPDLRGKFVRAAPLDVTIGSPTSYTVGTGSSTLVASNVTFAVRGQ